MQGIAQLDPIPIQKRGRSLIFASGRFQGWINLSKLVLLLLSSLLLLLVVVVVVEVGSAATIAAPLLSKDTSYRSVTSESSKTRRDIVLANAAGGVNNSLGGSPVI